MSAPNRRAMVERPGKDLSVRRQCVLLSLTRSGVYRSKPVARADDLAVMRAHAKDRRSRGRKVDDRQPRRGTTRPSDRSALVGPSHRRRKAVR
jgi:hypothetical protein